MLANGHALFSSVRSLLVVWPGAPSSGLAPPGMQKPQPDLWSRTHGRAPTTTSLLPGRRAQQRQSSAANSSELGVECVPHWQ